MSNSHFLAQMVVSILTILLRVWGAFGLPIARFIVTTWVRAYTHPAVASARSDRRSEMASDVAEQITALRAEGYHPSEIGAHVLVRMIFGIWPDIKWMATHLEVLESAWHSRLLLNADLALFRLFRLLAERQLDALEARKKRGERRNPFRGLVGAFMTLYVWVLIYGIEEATYARDKAKRRLAEIEEHLRIGGLWPEDRHALEAEASRLRYMVRNMFRDPEAA